MVVIIFQKRYCLPKETAFSKNVHQFKFKEYKLKSVVKCSVKI